MQSQFDYSTDSYHSGTEATRFHVISHISHIISSLSIIIHFQQKHGCFPQLSSPISQEKTGCAGETGWSSTTGGWWIQWDGSLGRVEWGTLFCYIGYTCLLDLLGKNVVSVFRLFFLLKRFVIIVIGQILKSLIFSLGTFGADGFVSLHGLTCPTLTWIHQMDVIFWWMSIYSPIMLHSWLRCRMSRTQTEMKSVGWCVALGGCYSKRNLTKSSPSPSAECVSILALLQLINKMWQCGKPVGIPDNKVFNGIQCYTCNMIYVCVYHTI